MSADIGNLTLLQNGDLVGDRQCTKAVTDNDYCKVGFGLNSRERFPEITLCIGIKLTRRLVKDEYFGRLQDSARQVKSLALATRKPRASFRENRVVSVRKAHDKIMRPRELCSFFDSCLIGV